MFNNMGSLSKALLLATPMALAAGCSDADAPGRAASALSAEQCNYFQVGGRVTICHATGSTRNPTVVVRVSEQACVSAHSSHAGDRVAPDGNCGPDACLPVGAPVDDTLACCGIGNVVRAGSVCACAAGYADCDGDAVNGCEADLDTAEHCGACGATCAAGQTCAAGTCVTLSTTAPPTLALSAWFDASSESPGPIGAWADRSAAHRDAQQSVSTAYPVVVAGALNGRNAVHFDGAAQHLTLPDGTMPEGDGSYTVFVAGSWDDIYSTYNGVLGWGGIYGGHILVNPGGYAYQWWGVDAVAGVAAPGVPNAAPSVVTYVYASAQRQLALYINGVARASATAPYARTASSTQTTLGRAPDFWGTNNPMRGYLGEVLIYARALSDAEIASVNTYLRTRWVP